MAEFFFPLGLGSDVSTVVEHNAMPFDRADVALVRMLVKGDEHIGLVTGAKDFAGTDAHLKNRRTTRDRRWDGHVGHDVMFTAAGESGQERACRLDSILRITREPDHRVLNAFRPQIGSFGIRCSRLCSSIRSFAHVIRNVTD